MEGFTKAQLRAFSKRSAQIESELEAKGAMYESPTLRMRADDEASLATRAAKDRSLTPSLLAGRWQGEAGQVGLATGADLDQALCADPARSGAPGWDEVAAALVDPETGLCSRSARFTQADVVEHICALSAGRMSVEEIVVMADRFVGSDLAVRLTPDIAAGRPRPAQWSTAAHRALEDRTLALMGTLAARPSAGVAESATKAALAGAPGLGDDQVAAVQVLAGEGGSLRAVLAPAGYGKTTMLHTAARAAAADDRPVVAVATTALPAAPETRQLRRPYRAEQAQQRLSPVPATVPPGHSALASCGRPPTAKVRASRKSSSERTTQWRGMRCSAPVRSGLSIYRPAHECSLPAAANRPGYYACQDSIIMLGAKNA